MAPNDNTGCPDADSPLARPAHRHRHQPRPRQFRPRSSGRDPARGRSGCHSHGDHRQLAREHARGNRAGSQRSAALPLHGGRSSASRRGAQRVGLAGARHPRSIIGGRRGRRMRAGLLSQLFPAGGADCIVPAAARSRSSGAQAGLSPSTRRARRIPGDPARVSDRASSAASRIASRPESTRRALTSISACTSASPVGSATSAAGCTCAKSCARSRRSGC